jgi:HD-like signal output (HDOD) protein
VRILSDVGASTDAALAGALLRDIGLLVFAAQEPAYLEEILGEAHRAGRPLVEIEYDRGGVTHAAVGAHLLALWGLPHEVVDCVAFHHEPPMVCEARVDAAIAVYIADALLEECRGGPGPEPAYLECLGVVEHLPAWRELAAGGAQPEPFPT